MEGSGCPGVGAGIGSGLGTGLGESGRRKRLSPESEQIRKDIKKLVRMRQEIFGEGDNQEQR